MNAISLLTRDHREVEDLFDRLDSTDDESQREELFQQLAMALTIHTVIEEQHFYPAVREKNTERLLRDFLGDHQEMKDAIRALLDLDVTEENFDQKLQAMRETFERHILEEEQDLFPKVQRMLRDDTLEALGQEMLGTKRAISEMNPREVVDTENVTFPSMS